MRDVICNEAVTFRPYCAGFATRTRNVSEYMLVLALCLVRFVRLLVGEWSVSTDVLPPHIAVTAWVASMKLVHIESVVIAGKGGRSRVYTVSAYYQPLKPARSPTVSGQEMSTGQLTA